MGTSSQRDGLTPDETRTKLRVPLLTEAARSLRRRRRSAPIRPHSGDLPDEQSPSTGKSGALRAGIFGINDGLVSNLSLIMGVAGAGTSRSVILLSGIAGLLAGAFSMGAGEYVSMRTQRETLERLIHLEAHEIALDPEGEREELTAIYVDRGIAPDLAAQVAEALMRDPDIALRTHAREELGLDPDELGSPWGAAGSSFLTFTAGAFVPLVAFLFTEGQAAIVIASILSGVTLLGVGGAMSIFTGRSPLVSAARMLLIGAGAATVTYLVGSLLHVGVAG
jgi:vacuolar iron transporter family protein